jgi:hypothetical protein
MGSKYGPRFILLLLGLQAFMYIVVGVVWVVSPIIKQSIGFESLRKMLLKTTWHRGKLWKPTFSHKVFFTLANASLMS